jgi:hypothetical protein
VVERLKLKALTKVGVDPSDNRRRVIKLTVDGGLLARGSIVKAARMTESTRAPAQTELSPELSP